MSEINYNELKNSELVMMLRDCKEKKSTVAAKLKVLTEQLDQEIEAISSVLKEKMTDEGLDNLKINGVGTVYFKTSTILNKQDGAAFFDFCLRNGCTELIDARVFKRVTEEYIANTGVVPDGLYHDRIREISFRKDNS